MIILPPRPDDDDAEIIELANHREGAEPKLRTLRPATCFCTFVCNVQTRVVTCTRCGRVWDPFDALVYITRTHWDRYAANRDALQREIIGKTKIRDGLRNEVRNLKAQRKRLIESG